MRILAIDVGTGTQDILLVDTESTIENALKLVMPSPTLTVGRRIREATRRRQSLLFHGPMMGGGPSAWALRDHVAAGLPAFATVDAARTLDDDLSRVEALGVGLVTEDEAAGLSVDVRIRSGDLMLDAVNAALQAFGVQPRYDVLAAAVFDHGDAPPGVSDRTFRFDYLRQTLQSGSGLLGFAHSRETVPAALTRLRAVAEAAPADVPLVVMDTGPAAVLGALEDQAVRSPGSQVVVNVGNFHTLAFRLSAGGVAGLFEHHTGEITTGYLELLVRRLADGSITNKEVFDSMGHGALVLQPSAPAPDLVAVLGPQRGLLHGSTLRAHRAVPHGDQMVAGCYGLLRGAASCLPWARAEIEQVLDPNRTRQPDW